jgi:hypothetical protein
MAICHFSSLESIGAIARKRTGLEIIFMAPLVTRSNVKSWEQYSVGNYKWWREQSQNISMTSNTGVVPTDYKPGGIIPFVFFLGKLILYRGTNQNASGPFLPLWQITPTPFNPQSTNFDMLQTEDSKVAERIGEVRGRGKHTDKIVLFSFSGER